MQLGKSLWVEDKYAVRCRTCAKEFALLRRRHHCRQCGQVFCSACLYNPNDTVSDGVTAAQLPNVRALLAHKLCTHCASLIIQRRSSALATGPNAPTSRPNDGVPPTAAATEPRRVPDAGANQSQPEDTLRAHGEAVPELSVAYSIEDVDYYRQQAVAAESGLSAWVRRHVGGRQMPATAVTHRDSNNDTDDTSMATLFDGITGDAAFIPAELRVQALQVYARRLADLTATHGISDATLVKQITVAVWAAVRRTHVPWGGNIIDQVKIIPVANTPTTADVVNVRCTDALTLPMQLASTRMPREWPQSPRILLLVGDVTMTEADHGQALGDLTEYVASYQGHLDKLFQRIRIWGPQVIVVEGGMHHHLQRRIAEAGGASLILNAGAAALGQIAGACGATVVGNLQYVSLAELQDPGRSPMGTCKAFRAVAAPSSHSGGNRGSDRPLCFFEGLPRPWFTTILVGDARGAETSATCAAIRESIAALSDTLSLLRCAASVGLRAKAPSEAPSASLSDIAQFALTYADRGTESPPSAITIQRVQFDAIGLTREGPLAGAHSPVVQEAAFADDDDDEDSRSAQVPASRHFTSETLPCRTGNGSESLLAWMTRAASRSPADDGGRYLLLHGGRKIVVSSSPVAHHASEAKSTRFASQLLQLQADSDRFRERSIAWTKSGLNTTTTLVTGLSAHKYCGQCGNQKKSQLRVLAGDALNLPYGAFLQLLFSATPDTPPCCDASGDCCQFAGRLLIAVGDAPAQRVHAVTFEVSPISLFSIAAPRLRVTASDALNADWLDTAPATAGALRSGHVGKVLSAALGRFHAIRPPSASYGGDRSGWRLDALRALASTPHPTTGGGQDAEDAQPGLCYLLRGAKLGPEAAIPGAAAAVAVETLFPVQFAALQQLYTDGDIDSLLAALRNTSVYRPQGGKTNTTFYVTADGRYLLKQIKQHELRHFAAWAGHYFAYMAELYAADGPAARSLLAKSLGLFAVQEMAAQRTTSALSGSTPRSSFRASSSVPSSSSLLASSPSSPHSRGAFVGFETTEMAAAQPSAPQYTAAGGVQYFVLMETTAGRDALPAIAVGPRSTEDSSAGSPVIAFDLKGSQRNRTAPADSTVKLDGDFLGEWVHQGRLFFCTRAEKRLFISRLSRDVRLLRRANIMDYSLFVLLRTPSGSDPFLEASIIDYLHPFTGAKLLESKMKSGLDTVLGYAGRDPTIVDPDAYAERFLRWMNCYLCSVPRDGEN